jgi:hypothetical protein
VTYRTWPATPAATRGGLSSPSVPQRTDRPDCASG